MSWTTGQNDVISELGHRGVAVVHDALLECYGVDHSLHAIEIQASHIHVSLRVQVVCPECEAAGDRIKQQTGCGAIFEEHTANRMGPEETGRVVLKTLTYADSPGEGPYYHDELVWCDDTPDVKVQMSLYRRDLGIRARPARKGRMRKLSYEGWRTCRRS